MKKKLLLLALLGFMLMGCGSKPVEDVAVEDSAESEAVNVAEVTTKESEWVELKIPESTVVVEEEKEEPKFVFDENYMEKFSRDIEDWTNKIGQDSVSVECLGIEMVGYNTPLMSSAMERGQIILDSSLTYLLYFLIDGTEIVRIDKYDIGVFDMEEKMEIMEFGSVDEFKETAYNDPFIMLIDKSDTSLTVDMEEVIDYVEFMTPAYMERCEIEKMINAMDKTVKEETDAARLKEIVKETESYISNIISACCGENYTLIAYDKGILENSEQNLALIVSFEVEGEDGKLYTCHYRSCYKPTAFIGKKDTEEYIKYIQEMSEYPTFSTVLWEDN